MQLSLIELATNAVQLLSIHKCILWN